MNKTLMFLQADMHRAINAGQKSMDVSILDIKELLSIVLKSEYQEVAAQAHIFGWIDPVKLREMRENGRYYASIRRGKNAIFTEPVFCIPKPKQDVDAIAQTEDNSAHSSD
jgi:hypothetical protein